ncbi:TIGR02678 family protein [Catonella morbi ATCC 51271]|jgi:TIGR02678 family protein|uniref:TIGR02678 family protein n=1 Tax=Catonella morbi ATCC 51271 TaxID=592026 RepID=V2Z8K2_9FIRM|nr:TIGR02678 family protein [Catonella morbi]ESL03260.1 TIGR02678 family protein [Catonella morbi ATCC 51271]
MKALEVLLSKRWILKSRDRELYYSVRDELPKFKSFLIEKLGFQVVVNSYLIKLEKIPAVAENWMGIKEFSDKMEYVIFMTVLMFLEEKDMGEQFVLSELTEYIQTAVEVESIDWTVYRSRKYLVKVMKYLVSEGILEINDGSEEDFQKDGISEVLYENTGVSRNFVKNFTRDISNFKGMADFYDGDFIDTNEDRGIVRRQRVYRKLLLSAGLYRNENTEEDFNYIRNFRGIIANDFESLFDCNLHIHKSSAYLVINEGSRLGRAFPEESTLSDIVLLVNDLILSRIDENKLTPAVDESIILSLENFNELIEETKRLYGNGFAKTYRDMTTKEICSVVTEYMMELGFIEYLGNDVKINPIVGKVAGRYPKDFESVQE